MAREALFNWLQSRIDWPEVRVLDLCCGTGAIGLECLSRGAEHADFVDIHPAVIRELQRTLEKWKVENAVCYTRNWKTFLQHTPAQYNLIVCDPPYDKVAPAEIHQTLLQLSHLIKPGGILVIEHSGTKGKEMDKFPHFLETRNYGAVFFSFFGWS